jgi:hypothetical protein
MRTIPISPLQSLMFKDLGIFQDCWILYKIPVHVPVLHTGQLQHHEWIFIIDDGGLRTSSQSVIYGVDDI